MILREATPADIPALSELAIASFNAKFAHLYSAENLTAFLEESLSERAITAELANPTRVYRLAESDDGAVSLLIDNPSAIRRPVVEWPNGRLTIGFTNGEFCDIDG